MAGTTKTYRGTSRTDFQDALNKAIASASRALAKGDRSFTWTLKSVSGSAGGLAPRPQIRVAIEATAD